FDYNIRNFLTDPFKETSACCHFPVEAVSLAVSAIAAHSHGFVIIDLHIAEPAFLQGTDYLVFQIINYPGILHIPKSPHTYGQRDTILFYQMGSILVAPALIGSIFHFKP